MPEVKLIEPYRWSKLAAQVRVGFRRVVRHKIFNAIDRGDEAEVLRLATPTTLKRARNEFDRSPLSHAISRGRTELAICLVSRGGMGAGDGSIALAAMHGDLQVVECLVAAGKDPNERLPKDSETPGYTPLMWATNRRHLSVVRVLLGAGANVDAEADNGTTAVMLTIKGAPTDLEILRLLCSYGPDITKKDWRGRNLIREARDWDRNSGRPEMRQIIEHFFPGTDFDAA